MRQHSKLEAPQEDGQQMAGFNGRETEVYELVQKWCRWIILSEDRDKRFMVTEEYLSILAFLEKFFSDMCI